MAQLGHWDGVGSRTGSAAVAGVRTNFGYDYYYLVGDVGMLGGTEDWNLRLRHHS